MMKLLTCLIIFYMACLNASHLWAMSEDEYVNIAAENLKVIHEAKGDSQAVMQSSQDFLKKFSEEEIKAYIEMAQRIMQDPKLAKRISEKVINLLTQMGYKVKAVSPTDINTIVIEK